MSRILDTLKKVEARKIWKENSSASLLENTLRETYDFKQSPAKHRLSVNLKRGVIIVVGIAIGIGFLRGREIYDIKLHKKSGMVFENPIRRLTFFKRYRNNKIETTENRNKTTENQKRIVVKGKTTKIPIPSLDDSSINLQGISNFTLNGLNHNIAVINGRTVQKGHVIDGYRITKIGTSFVELDDGQQTWALNMYKMKNK